MTTFKAEVSQQGKAWNPSQVTQEMRRAYKLHLLRAGLIFQGEVQPRTPFGVTGKLRRGWVTEMESDSSCVVYNSEEYALVIEKGRRPGKFVPIKPLELWVKRVLSVSDPVEARGIAFAISRKIAKNGIPSNPDYDNRDFAANAFNDATPAMNSELQKMGASIVKGLQQ